MQFEFWGEEETYNGSEEWNGISNDNRLRAIISLRREELSSDCLFTDIRTYPKINLS